MNLDEDRLRAKVQPEAIGTTMLRAACFLAGWELIKAEVEDKVRGFYLTGFDESGLTYDEASYRTHVLSRDRQRFKASSSWLVASGGLTSEQADLLEIIRHHRNEVAHELPRLLVDPDFEVRTDLLIASLDCLRSLGIFWGSIEVDTNPDIDGREVDYGGIKSMSFMLMEYLVTLVGIANDELGTAEVDDEQ